MRCRRIKRGGASNTVVWFGSYGKAADGSSLFFNENDIHDNFADRQEGVADSLTQRLSVIEGELWYNVSFGLPLMEKIDSKIAIDAAVSQIVLSHPDVVDITEFESSKSATQYRAKMKISTNFGELSLEI